MSRLTSGVLGPIGRIPKHVSGPAASAQPVEARKTLKTDILVEHSVIFPVTVDEDSGAV